MSCPTKITLWNLLFIQIQLFSSYAWCWVAMYRLWHVKQSFAGVWLWLITSLCHCELGREEKKRMVCYLWALALRNTEVKYTKRPSSQLSLSSLLSTIPTPYLGMSLCFPIILPGAGPTATTFAANVGSGAHSSNCLAIWGWLQAGIVFFFKTSDSEPQSFGAQKTWQTKQVSIQFPSCHLHICRKVLGSIGGERYVILPIFLLEWVLKSDHLEHITQQ